MPSDIWVSACNHCRMPALASSWKDMKRLLADAAYREHQIPRQKPLLCAATSPRARGCRNVNRNKTFSVRVAIVVGHVVVQSSDGCRKHQNQEPQLHASSCSLQPSSSPCQPLPAQSYIVLTSDLNLSSCFKRPPQSSEELSPSSDPAVGKRQQRTEEKHNMTRNPLDYLSQKAHQAAGRQ